MGADAGSNDEIERLLRLRLLRGEHSVEPLNPADHRSFWPAVTPLTTQRGRNRERL